jgi:hypothetical protein
MKYKFSKILGWSQSRFDVFSSCKRKYYYRYYKGFDKESGESKIKQLTALVSVDLAIGQITHVVFEILFKRLKNSNSAIDITRLDSYIKNETEKYCRENVFFETYYKEAAHISVDDIAERVKLFIHSFINSERFIWLKNQPLEYRSKWVIEPKDFGETRIDNLKAYCKVDFMFPVENALYIIDWKTGKEDEIRHKKQLLGYSFYAQNNYAIEAENIIPIIGYLKNGYEEVQVSFTNDELEAFKDMVAEETNAMYECTINVEENIPAEKEHFTMTDRVRFCSYCEFKELCNRE